MASIDKRVVEMKFDNADFERRVGTTLSTLGKLREGLGNLGNSAKGLGTFKVNSEGLTPLSRGVDALVTKFSALQVAGVAAIAGITNKAVNAGLSIAKSLTIAPISGGLGEYEKKLSSIQTILANTQAAGTNLSQVSGALDELNKYSDQTIYNFGEMAKNIGTFTAAGVGLETATASIKGIANLAALSGSSSEQASTAMYQLSQAISAGRVSLMDWNSVVNAGMGGSVFQRALAQTAVAMGKLPAEALKLEGAMKNVKINGQSFRESISAEGGPSWLTSDVLTTALGNFTGDMKEADLVAQGFSKSQAALIMQQAAMAQDAATKVKTATQLMSTLKESAESGFAETWELIIGDFNEAPLVFTGINNAIGGIITRSAESRNLLLADWKKLGGRQDMLDGFIYAWRALKSIVTPIREAFRSIFPATTGQQLADLSEKFRLFAKGLILGEENMENLKRTFRGVFAVLNVVVTVAKDLFQAFFGVIFSGAQSGSGGLLAFTAIVGDVLYGIQRILLYKDAIGAFFDVFALLTVGPIVAIIKVISNLAIAIGQLLQGDVSGFRERFQTAFEPLGELFDKVADKFGIFGKAISGTFESLATYLSGMARRLTSSGNTMAAGIIGGLSNVATFLKSFFTDARGTVDGLVTMFTSATSAGQGFLSGFGSAGSGKVKILIDELSRSFQNFKDKLEFKPKLASFSDDLDGASASAAGASSIVSRIAGAIGSALSSIGSGLASLGGGLADIITSLKNFFTTLMDRITEFIRGADGDDAVAAFNTGVLVALFVVVKNFLGSFKTLVQSFADMMTNISEVFGSLKDTLAAMQRDIQANIILKIAIAVGVLVAAMYVLSKLDGGQIAKGLGAIGVLFAALAGTLVVIEKYAMGDSPAKTLAAAVALVAMSIAVALLATAVERLGKLSWSEMLKGLTAVGVLLVGLTLFTKFAETDKGGIKAGAGLILLAVAINILAGAVAILGNMDTGNLIKGVTAVGASVAILAIAAQKMEGTLKGSAAMLVMASALAVLTPVLVTLGLLPYENLAKGLGTVAIGLGLLAIAANQMSTALPGATAMIAVAGALAIITPAIVTLGLLSLESISKGLITIGAALLILVTATNAMSTAMPGAVAMLAVAGALAILAPVLVILGQLSWEAISKGLIALAGALAIIVVGMYALAPVIVIMSLFSGSIALLGAAVLAAGLGFLAFSAALTAAAAVGTAGFAVLVAGVVSFLAVLPLIAKQVGYAFVTFINEIGKAAPVLIRAFTNIVLEWLKSLQKTAPEMIKTMGVILMAMLNEIVRRAPEIYNAGLNLIIGFLAVMRTKLPLIIVLVADLLIAFMDTVRLKLPQIIQSAINLIIAFVNGLADGIRREQPRINAAGVNLATALIEGAISGITAGLTALISSAQRIGNTIIDAAKKVLGINSPSKIFSGIGGDIIRGIVEGIGNLLGNLRAKAGEIGSAAISAAKAAIKDPGAVGRAIVDGIIKGISGGLSLVKDAATRLAKGALDAAKGFLGINSPSKEFIKVGESVNEGFYDGLTSNSREKVNAAFEDLSRLIEAAMTSANAEIDKSTKKLEDLTKAQVDNTNARKAATTELNTDIEKLRVMTAERKNDEAAIRTLGQEIIRDKERIKQLTSARNVDAEAVKKARAELTKDEAALRSLTQSRAADIEAIRAKGVEIEADRERLRKLSVNEKENAEAIRDTKAAIEEATSERDRAVAASQAITTQFAAERDKLAELGDQYQELGKQLDEANKALDSAIKTRDDYNKTISDQYGNLGDIKKDTTLADYIGELEAKIEANQTFAESLQALRDLGLNDQMYKKLLTEGIDAIPFVQELEAGGREAVYMINELGVELGETATSLGTTASSQLYEAGVQAAQGLVSGLQSQRGNIEREVAAIAALVAQAMAEKLKIKSPSRVMMRLGAFVGQGLAKGMRDSAPVIKTSASDLGDEAIAALQKTMSNLSLALESGVDLDPVIRPVMDLTDLKKGAREIKTLIDTPSVSVGSAYSAASSAAAEYRKFQEASVVPVSTTSSAPSSVTFVQNNSSPKALSSAEIYRQTKNQLSVAKGALTPRVNY